MENAWSKRSSGFMQDLMKAADFELKNTIHQAKKTKATTLEQDLRYTNSKEISVGKINNIYCNIENSSKGPCSPDKPKYISKINKKSENSELKVHSENTTNINKDASLSSKKRKFDYTVEDKGINDAKRYKDNVENELMELEKKLEPKDLSYSEDEYEDKELTMSSFFNILDISGVSSLEENIKENSKEVFLRNSNDCEDLAKTKVDNSFLYNEEKTEEPPDSNKFDIVTKNMFQEYPKFSNKDLTFSNKFKQYEDTFSLNGKETFIFDIKISPRSHSDVKDSPEIKNFFKIENVLNISSTELLKDNKRLGNLVLKCYECHICFEEFKYSKVLSQHIECHGIDKFQCVECEFCSMDVLEFYRHRASHTNTKPFTCNLCNYEAILMEELTEHVLLHYGKTYECNMCYFSSTLKDELNEHIKSHDKEIELDEHRILIDDSLHFQENILWQFGNSPLKNVEFSGSLKNNQVIHNEGYSSPTSIKNESPNIVSKPCVQNNLHTISCDICDYECNKKSHLDMHMITHSGGRNYKCSQCDYSCRRKQNLTRHMKKHINKNYLKCPECNYKSYKKYNFERHMATHTMNLKKKPCSLKNNYLQDHEKIIKPLVLKKDSNENRNFLKCPECNYKSYKKYNFERHLATHTMNLKKKPCSLKNKYLQDHKKIIKPLVLKKDSNENEFESSYNCKECSFACKTNIELIIHRLVHNQYFRCTECKYKSNKKVSIVKHLQKHVDEYQECNYGCKCSKCEYWNYKKTEFDTQVLVHKSKKTNKCDQCNIAFRSIADLKRHIMIHTGEKPFKCTQCNYATSRSHSLRLHQTLRHSINNNYKCCNCEYQCNSAKDLKVHQKTCFQDLKEHLSIRKKIFKCNLCDYSCTQESELKLHMYNIHPKRIPTSLKGSKLKNLRPKKKNLKRNKI